MTNILEESATSNSKAEDMQIGGSLHPDNTVS
jgi:hypothetical protein